MCDITEYIINFCLPCVVAANLQSVAQLAIDDGIAMDITARFLFSDAFRDNNAAINLCQRWTFGANMFGAQPSYTDSDNTVPSHRGSVGTQLGR